MALPTDILPKALGRRAWRAGLIAGLLVLAAFLGLRPSRRWLMLLVAAAAAVTLLAKPALGLLGVVAAALVVPLQIGTGTEVVLNAATLLVPALLVLWLMGMLVRAEVQVAASQANAPLLYFLLVGVFSFLLGNVSWNPAVPKSNNFWLVQLAQWAIFAFAAGAFWLTGNLIEDELWLRRLTFSLLALGGCLAVARVLPGLSVVARRFSTAALDRAPFWMLLAALAGGQLLFNHRLSRRWRAFLIALLPAILVYSFFLMDESRSTWVGVAAVAGVLVWLRWPRLRWLALGLLAVLTVSGVAFTAVWEFAGGEEAWVLTGAPRLVLIERVVSVTMRNPITGLGPASYRPYANMKPLLYRRAFWVNPRISSHNNYIDIFAHTGIVGLVLFAWFAVAVVQLGLRLRRRFHRGFLAGYVNGVLAAGAGSLVIMLMADWLLPFVYNIGFPGFQASLLVWLFLGGLVAIDQMQKEALFGG